MRRNDDRAAQRSLESNRIAADAPGAIERAARIVVGGGVVAIPTDTVYGVAASLARPEALQRLYHIKGRPDDKPLPVLLASSDAMRLVAVALPAEILALADRFWPGPLTVVAPARPDLPALATGKDRAGRPTVGLRVPDHAAARAVIERVGGALAVTSANRSGEASSASADDVERALGKACDLIFDAGAAPVGVSSTVVAIEDGQVVVLREGAIPAATVAAVWRELR
ncbi:MAG TPA: L-threonylcarbamoyladenylate synthase [Thermomicrobiales bacterium]|nr:L-threonylcarbamoyladenylate synthase [Thermomicrobiales bacterium]